MYDDEILEERVDRLETILGDFILHTSESLNRLSREMREFKNEIRAMNRRWDKLANRMGDIVAPALRPYFNEDIEQFVTDVRRKNRLPSDFKNERRESRREMNRQWGKLANKMGTLVGDIVAPAVRPVIKRYFNEDIEQFATNVRRKNKALNLTGEFDVIAAGREKVFVVEVKSSPSKDYLNKFDGKREVFTKLFPEYEDKTPVLIFGSLRFDEELIPLATDRNIYALAYREWDYMDIMNFEDIGSV